MTQHFVTVEDGGNIIRGLAVPFGESAYFIDKDDKVVAEQFDEESVQTLPSQIPLLVSHDRHRAPAGVVTAAGISRFGIGIEARLVGSDDEVEGWRRKLAAGLMASLSVGFTSQGRQVWRAPERRGAPPMVIRRSVEIVEISLVNWPAYDGATIVSLSQRTAEDDIAHSTSERLIAEFRADQIRTETWMTSRSQR